MFCEMSPVIERSVTRSTPNTWLLGSSMMCMTNLITAPANVKASWVGEHGKTFYITAASATADPFTTEQSHDDSLALDRVHQAGTGSAVWLIGGAYVKVKAWKSETQSEGNTIEYLKRWKSGVPVPDVISSWIDEAWNRSFLILKSIPGSTLHQAWPGLSSSQKTSIADQIASFCSELAELRQPKMHTLDGKGVLEPFLLKTPLPEVPSWIPITGGPFSAEQLSEYLQDSSIVKEPSFYFYHADLGPTNIILDGEGHVTAIIDWESAAYYPRFWLATKPLVSAGFYLKDGDRKEWANLLSHALVKKGFNKDLELYNRWSSALEN